MTVFKSEPQSNDPFAAFYPQPFVRLTTFRKSGEAVPTTVWFAPDQAGHIYVTTQASAGKLKRIRHTARVQLAPADFAGNLLPGYAAVAGSAREITPAEHKLAEAAFLTKYGDEYTALIARMGDGQSIARTYIEIVPTGEHA